MEDLKGNAQLQQLLADAMEQLSDVKHKMGLFEKQRYYRMKKQLEDYQKLPTELRSGLAQISTSKTNFS